MLPLVVALALTPPLVTPYAQAKPLRLGEVVLARTDLKQQNVAEFSLNLDATYDNPFDPDDIRVDLEVTSPTQKQFVQPAFFGRPYRRAQADGKETLTPDGDGQWQARFCPAESGIYRARVRAQDRSGEVVSAETTFAVAPSDDPGMVRVSPRDPRYFEFSTGKPYWPIGANVCWAGDRGTADYDDWFPRYKAAGCNYARFWLSPGWTTFALERTGKREDGLGMGQFDLANAWRIDYGLQLAHSNGLQVMLTIDSYNILRDRDAYNFWELSPQNRVHGGPLRNWAEFWTLPEMARLYRNKLRYLVARYGAFPNVFAWEFWNEVDLTRDFKAPVARGWHQEMARYLKQQDAHRHLVSTSFAETAGEETIDRLPEIDFVQTHHYGSADLGLTVSNAHIRKVRYGKPHFVSEIGADAGGPAGDRDRDGLQIHDPLWSSLAVGASGAAMPWWWDSYIHPQNLYSRFASPASFVEGIDWPAEGFRVTRPTIAYATNPAPVELRDVSLRNGPVSWEVSETNRPRSVTVRNGVFSGELPVAGIQHGRRNHLNKHNPVTFSLRTDRPVQFVVEVGTVSGYGGATLRIRHNGAVVLTRDFRDLDNATTDLTQYAGDYGISLPKGNHRVVVENVGNDWFMVGYRIENAMRRRAPAVSGLGIVGNDVALAWFRHEERSWRNVAILKARIKPAAPSVVRMRGLSSGRWQVDFWDTWNGRRTRSQVLGVGLNGVLRFDLPSISKDMAVRCRRVPRAR
jgi:hypothetical protein